MNKYRLHPLVLQETNLKEAGFLQYHNVTAQCNSTNMCCLTVVALAECLEQVF